MAADFLDSNVLVYAFSKDRRADTAKALLQTRPTISVQGLNEFANVAHRKLGMDWQEVREAISAIRVFCPTVMGIDLATHEAAVSLAERYRHSLFDSLLIASALHAHSDTLWSEDMQDGMLIDGRLRIMNPFRKED